MQEDRFAVIGPKLREQLRLYLAGRDTNQGDTVGNNGRLMERFGFQLYYSNNLPFTATLGMATNPTDGDTVVINGCTLEFKTTISGATSGYIGVLLDGSDVDTSRAALEAAINDSGTAGTTYTAQATGIDTARWKLTKAGVVATNDNDNDQLTIVAYGDIAVSETFTDTTDAWASQQQHMLAGIKRSTLFVTQYAPEVEEHIPEKQFGKYILALTMYGKKTPLRAKDGLCQAVIDASAWT
jgi:hypothetical protein